ncbi:MAG: ATP-binding protein [Planctomycetia bacterium]
MQLPRIVARPTKTFLILGPRGTGKSTWLAAAFPGALTIDLLDSARFLTLSRDPSALEQLVAPLRRGDWVVIDEIQRIPALLDVVHRLYERHRGIHFALSGSSARKLRRAGANLLAGRALHLPMLPFAWPEYRGTWRIDEACEWGTLPLVVSDPANREATLAAYVDTYLKEEITAEALVRNLDPFVRVLNAAGLFNGQILNLENLARESEVKRSTIERYFQILEDTLLATRVPAATLGIRTKETAHPKFFLFDTGVARAAAGRAHEPVDSVWKGFAFESLLHHELRAYAAITGKPRPIFHYAVSGGFDVDFLVQTRAKTLSTPRQLVAIEAKLGGKFKRGWTKGLTTLLRECPKTVRRAILIYQGPDRLVVDGVDVMPATTFFDALYAGQVI